MKRYSCNIPHHCQHKQSQWRGYYHILTQENISAFLADKFLEHEGEKGVKPVGVWSNACTRYWTHCKWTNKIWHKTGLTCTWCQQMWCNLHPNIPSSTKKNHQIRTNLLYPLLHRLQLSYLVFMPLLAKVQISLEASQGKENQLAGKPCTLQRKKFFKPSQTLGPQLSPHRKQ